MVFALSRKRAAAIAVAICAALPLVRFASGQVIEFDSKGLHYQALTKGGMTVMYAPIPSHIKDFSIIQVAITNGTGVTWMVKNQDFKFIRQDGVEMDPISADAVVESLLAKASHSDVIQLQLLYENTIYALANFRSTNGYEKRRQAMMTFGVSSRFKAAAAASAIAFAPVKLKAGESTDGAIFFVNVNKDRPMGAGRLLARCGAEDFEFETLPEVRPK
jgi:hypothetical protein